MKYENIKPGEKVLIPVSVRYGFNSSEEFLIEKEVLRTTKTLFVVNIDGKELKFKKDSGRQVGGNYFDRARFVGEEYYDLNRKCIATDQTQEMMQFKKKVRAVNKLNHDIQNLNRFSPADFESLEEVSALIEAVEILVKSQKEQ